MSGKAAAAALFKSDCLAAYPNGIAEVCAQKKQAKTDLVSLDSWLRSKWPAESRSTAGLNRDSLVKIATWKLSKGKWRPLLPRIQSNSETAVSKAWRAAKEARSDSNAKGGPAAAAVSALSELDGVGPATASAVLAPCFEDIPFMSDEAMDAVGCPHKYDLKTYTLLVEKLNGKAAALGKNWTAEKVGRALWACNVLALNEKSAPSASRRSLKRPASASAGESSPRVSKRPAMGKKTIDLTE
eukprot:TRINITY_DN30144_c0_g1_i2.p1 TRINITY_DN30144_c0_g1~~TRINITY_DN30144_c0_g1_i2.p1  ORF type:complete len:242 (-),score=62.97 TRINITY_DN30144_c0_g1_i2:121-846(-)